jgi:NAD(P)H-flavin reductase
MGPYGSAITNDEVSNVLALSGGTGITYTLPVIINALSDASPARNIELVWTIRHLENLAWIASELAYLKSQLDGSQIDSSYNEDKLEKAPIVSVETKKRFRIRIFVTRPDTRKHQQPSRQLYSDKGDDFGDKIPMSQSPSTDSTLLDRRIEELSRQCPNFSITWLNNARPDVPSLVDAFMSETVEKGRTQVIGSGPPELGTQLRAAVAAKNVPGNVWRGDEVSDVECVWDDRMG